ncbi:hypothetical protein SAMN05421833_127111 [Microbispora rosea]|uniref:Uncharacterized protein n=1 Tax=Microbispora rosea TaxID=58117 RepID=A0A1N7GC78_9ACTN|nr:hypothetical protein Mro03_39380 [Microbispora rosea subsp. rosea]SIS10189.1 hypothetical protein SAMN05421833_127111 [Microbispora rosea]
MDAKLRGLVQDPADLLDRPGAVDADKTYSSYGNRDVRAQSPARLTDPPSCIGRIRPCVYWHDNDIPVVKASAGVFGGERYYFSAVPGFPLMDS